MASVNVPWLPSFCVRGPQLPSFSCRVVPNKTAILRAPGLPGAAPKGKRKVFAGVRASCFDSTKIETMLLCFLLRWKYSEPTGSRWPLNAVWHAKGAQPFCSFCTCSLWLKPAHSCVTALETSCVLLSPCFDTHKHKGIGRANSI